MQYGLGTSSSVNAALIPIPLQIPSEKYKSMNPYIKLIRLKAWYAFFLLAFLGYVISGGIIMNLVDLLVFLVMLSAYVGFSFAINDCYDVEEDLLKESKHNPVADGEITRRRALAYSFSLALIGVLLSGWFGLTVFVYFTCLTLLALFYSVPPLRFKTRYPLDILSHGLFFGTLILVLPALIFGSMTSAVLLIAVSIFVLSITVELWNHIIDFESDSKAQVRTTACVLGLDRSEKVTRILSFIFPITILPLFLDGTNIFLFIVTTTVYMAILLRKAAPSLLYSSEATAMYFYAILSYFIVFVISMITPSSWLFMPIENLIFS
ncbi:MAG: UbiA prenyltransferase family protein [Candidatus Thorarchaeota archaeon]